MLLFLLVLVLVLLLVGGHDSKVSAGFCVTQATRTRTRCHSSFSLLSLAVPLPFQPSESTIPTSSLAQQPQSDDQPQPPRVGVLLLNLGGPERTDDVERFLYNLFADPDIIQLPGLLRPLQPLIAWFISKRRAPKSIQAYQSIGGGSPILQYSQEQARLIQEQLAIRHGLHNVRTYIGMRYWYPFTEQALEDIVRDQIEALVIVPLYPQFSISTSGSSLRVLQEELLKNDYLRQKMQHTVVPSWYQRPGYIETMVQLLTEQLDSFTEEELQAQHDANPDLKLKHVLFSAHGVPQSYIEAGDPYEMQMQECVHRITQALPEKHKRDVQVHLSYQSRVGPIEWLRPYTDDVLPELGAMGVKNLVVVPISFVSEHIETLEEIDIQYRELAQEKCGITAWRRCPALNTHYRFVEDMADMVHDALVQEPQYSITEACVANHVRNVELQSPLDDAERLGIETAGIQGVGGGKGSGAGAGGGTLTTPGSGLAAQLSRNNHNHNNTMLLERWVARVAMVGVALTIVLELLQGQSMAQQLFGAEFPLVAAL